MVSKELKQKMLDSFEAFLWTYLFMCLGEDGEETEILKSCLKPLSEGVEQFSKLRPPKEV